MFWNLNLPNVLDVLLHNCKNSRKGLQNCKRGGMDAKWTELQTRLKQAGKFDKLSIYSEMIRFRLYRHDCNLLDSYREALGLWREYLNFDPHPPLALRTHLTDIFHYVFTALRHDLGPEHFEEAHGDFTRYGALLVDSDALAETCADLSFMFWSLNDYSRALEHGLRSLDLAGKSGNRTILPRRYTNVGFVLESMGEFDKAREYYGQGLYFGNQVNSEQVISLAYCGLGRVDSQTGSFKSAIQYFLEAKKYLTDETSDEYMTLCTNLGAAYGKLGDYRESLNCIGALLTEQVKETNPEAYYSAAANAAVCCIDLDELDRAEALLLECLEYDRGNNDQIAVIGDLINIGNIHLSRGDYPGALDLLDQSLKLSRETGNRIQEVVALFGKASTYLKMKEYETALTTYGEALEIAASMNMKKEMLSCRQYMAEACEALGKHSEALEHFRCYHNLESEFSRDQFNADLKNLYTQYEKKAVKRGAFHGTHALISVELSELVKAPFIGTSRVMREVLAKTMLCAENNDAPVLITGESGTGKEIIARIIHYASARKAAPFTSVNSVAFAESLVESTFFGSEKGAYTGSRERQQGYFEISRDGSVFLDEIGEMSLSMQSKLLRVLEEHVIHRVGGMKDVPLNFRLISATNKDLNRLCEQNLFRFDLLNRINTLEIHLPSLRERVEDIPLLIDYFLTVFCESRDSGKVIVSKQALDKLCSYDYPGNVRELRNIIQRSVLLCARNILEPGDIAIAGNPAPKPDTDDPNGSLNLQEWETRLIHRAMERAGGVQARAAVLLGISPFVLNRKLKRLSA
jgi:transcriptional regulator with PAS, ATPase and Fis domain